jgi:hypothetical protein
LNITNDRDFRGAEREEEGRATVSPLFYPSIYPYNKSRYSSSVIK